jgi:hypothetical protein
VLNSNNLSRYFLNIVRRVLFSISDLYNSLILPMVLLWFSEAFPDRRPANLVCSSTYIRHNCLRPSISSVFLFSLISTNVVYTDNSLVSLSIIYWDWFSAVSLVVLTTMSLTYLREPYTLRLSLTRSSIATT